MATSFFLPSSFGAQDQTYLKRRFSSYSGPAKLAAIWLLDVREMRKIEQLILHGDDETVMAFKGSQIGAVGMTAVSSAIISQLSSTTLQIPALSSVNWAAGGFIIAALLISVLAVMLSCVQQQALGTLNEAGGVRMWLSNGSASRVGSKDGSDAFSQGGARDGLETSVASLLLLKLPNALLLYGVTCFLVGFGLFLGLAWRQDLDNTPSRDSNFSVMVLYIVVGCVTFFGSGAVVKWKMSEVNRAEKVIGKDIEEGDDSENRSGDRSEDENSGAEGEVDHLLKKKKRTNCSGKEVAHHERIAKALENAARAHREVAKLTDSADQGRDD